MTFRDIVAKTMEILSAGPVAGGLEVGDGALRFVAADPLRPAHAMIRLAPGIFAEGRIKDEAAFRQALRGLRSQILGDKASSPAPINIVVSLSSINIYSQVFALPLLEGESLERAVDLNIKMALPSGTAETYSGWQTLSAAADSRIEILSAFFDKNLADDLTDVLREERFAPLAIEPRSLSLARLFKEAGTGYDARLPIIFVSADTSGLDVSIIRGGNLHFDYFHSWHDLQGTEKQMTLEVFRNAVIRSVSQILNFYNSHWKEPLAGILVAATGMEEEILKTVKGNFSLDVRIFAPRSSAGIGSEWFVAWGSALRGRTPRRDDKELSLLGIGAQELFRREQIEHFLRFWRLLVPLSLGVVLAVIFGARFFVGSLKTQIQSQAAFSLSPEDAREAAKLKHAAREFNTAAAYLAAVDATAAPKSPVLIQIFDIAARRDIAVSRLSADLPSSPVMLSGSAASEDAIREFKNELTVTSGIREVNLPLTEVHKEGERYVFSISFLASSPAAR